MKILLTGIAGFIGAHFAKKCLHHNIEVVGIDNLNNYYDVKLKTDRLKWLKQKGDYLFEKIDVSDEQALKSLFEQHQFDAVVHLAAQAGVRHSLKRPQDYTQSNLMGFTHILENCRYQNVPHLVYASSSSVYGANIKLPCHENDSVDHPVSFYAATKKANELMAHSYSHLYQLPTTGLRFFTVYGPWGRPDMALFKFVKAIESDQPLQLFNQGDMLRDFTFVEDIVQGVYQVMLKPPKENSSLKGKSLECAQSYAPYRIYNIGNNHPIKLMEFVHAIEKALGKKATIKGLGLQPGDVKATHASVELLEKDIQYAPSTSVEKGIEAFVSWYKNYYHHHTEMIE